MRATNVCADLESYGARSREGIDRTRIDMTLINGKQEVHVQLIIMAAPDSRLYHFR